MTEEAERTSADHLKVSTSPIDIRTSSRRHSQQGTMDVPAVSNWLGDAKQALVVDVSRKRYNPGPRAHGLPLGRRWFHPGGTPNHITGSGRLDRQPTKPPATLLPLHPGLEKENQKHVQEQLAKTLCSHKKRSRQLSHDVLFIAWSSRIVEDNTQKAQPAARSWRSRVSETDATSSHQKRNN